MGSGLVLCGIAGEVRSGEGWCGMVLPGQVG